MPSRVSVDAYDVLDRPIKCDGIQSHSPATGSLQSSLPAFCSTQHHPVLSERRKQKSGGETLTIERSHPLRHACSLAASVSLRFRNALQYLYSADKTK